MRQNNIIGLNGEHQLVRVRAEPHISFNCMRNIVYFDAGELLGGNWSNDNFRMAGNVYYDARPDARPETMRFAGATLEEWRKRGHDLGSVVGNPLFYSPRQFNFRLNPNSPALSLGFRPIDLRRAGVVA